MIPKRERKWMALSLAITFIVVAYGLWSMLHLPATQWHTRAFKGLFKNYGSQARILLFVVLAYYALLFVLQKKWLDAWQQGRKYAIQLLNLARRLHMPLAILAIGIIAVHIVGAFLNGFKPTFSHISGLLTGISLLPVPVAGVLRYKKLDRRWHLRCGLAFAALFLIHAFL